MVVRLQLFGAQFEIETKKMKIVMKKLLSLLMLVGILAVSCGKEQDGSTTNGGQNIAPSFSFAQGTYLAPKVGYEGGALSYNFVTNSNWSVSSQEAWIEIEPASGDASTTTFTILVSKNDTMEERVATVEIVYGQSNTITITINQDVEFCAPNEITYKTTNNSTLTPTTVEGFGANFVENIYKNGYGKLRFDGAIEEIPAEAFKGCTTLNSIILPDELKSIGNNAFENCTALQEVVFESEVTAIGEMTFSNCQTLQNITLSQSLTSLGAKAFSECVKLTTITIPDATIAIGAETFYNCISLAEVNLGSNVESIGDRAFEFCSSLDVINTPASVKSIGNKAFSQCHALTKVQLNSGIESIGQQAFSYCKYLTTITLPDTLNSLGSYAFNHCEKLTTAQLSNALTAIETATFANCTNLLSITIPADVTTIGESAFFGCENLSTFNCLATTPPTLGNLALDKYSKTTEDYTTESGDESVKETYTVVAIGANIYVPTASVDTYKSAAGWSNYASKITGKSF